MVGILGAQIFFIEQSADDRFVISAFKIASRQPRVRRIADQTVGRDGQEFLQIYSLGEKISARLKNLRQMPERVFAQNGISIADRLVMRRRGGNIARSFRHPRQQVIVVVQAESFFVPLFERLQFGDGCGVIFSFDVAADFLVSFGRVLRERGEGK